VSVNGHTVKPSHVVRIGDEVRAVLAHEKILGVKALPLKRGGAPEAALAVEDRTPPAPPRVETPARVLRDLAAGRPTKKDRREITRLRGY
jgi:ribosome-associated heat shock protein Hsp15